MSALPTIDSPVLTLPRYAPFAEAAEIMGLSEADLRRMVEAGTISAGMMTDGTLIVMIEQLPQTPDADEERPRVGEAEKKSLEALPLAVAGDDINARLAAIKREDFAHLEGVEIGLSEAAREFDIPYQILQKWIRRGYIRVIRVEGRRKFLNKADVALCAKVYRVRKPFGTRAPLLNDDGTPYLLKEPKLARLRRIAKLEQQNENG